MGWKKTNGKWLPQCEKCGITENNMLEINISWDSNGLDGYATEFRCKEHIDYDEKGNVISDYWKN